MLSYKYLLTRIDNTPVAIADDYNTFFEDKHNYPYVKGVKHHGIQNSLEEELKQTDVVRVTLLFNNDNRVVKIPNSDYYINRINYYN